MKKTIITFVLVVLAFIASTAFIAKYQSGIAGWTASPGEGTCNNCHGGGSSPSSSVSILASPAFSLNQYFVPGTTYTITINVAASGFSKFGFDCEILDASNANVGTMQSPGTGVYFLQYGTRKNAVHNSPKSGQGSVNFTFKWVAPAVGDTATIYATGNAVNGDGNTTGDFPLAPSFLQLNARPQQVDSVPTLGINELKNTPVIAVSIYPNPAAELTTIAYGLDQSQQVSIQLMDMYGKTVKEFMNEKEAPGSHSHLLDLQGISSGIYFVRLSGNGARLFQQMLSVR